MNKSLDIMAGLNLARSSEAHAGDDKDGSAAANNLNKNKYS